MARHVISSGKRELEFFIEGDTVTPIVGSTRPPGNTPMEALAEPLGSPGLEELAVGVFRIAVVLPDATRAWEKVPLMAEAVRSSLEGADSVDWIIGGGQHRCPTRDEVSLLLGRARRKNDLVHFHDPDLFRETGLVTSRGNRITLHEKVWEADLVVLVGGIAYHELAGFSGGRKALIPGVSGRNSIISNHSLCLDGGRISSSIGCGRLEGNPVHEDMMEYASLALHGKQVFIVNVIPDDRGIPWRYVAGDPVHAWERGVEIAQDLQTIWIEKKVDWVIVSPGGYPYDIDLYQATKSVTAVMGGLKENGTIVMVSELEDGLGPGNYGDDLKLSMKDPERALHELKKGFTIPAFCAFKLVLDLQDHPSMLVTPAKDTPFPGQVCSSMDEAVQFLKQRSLLKGKGLILPAGNCVVLRAE